MCMSLLISTSFSFSAGISLNSLKEYPSLSKINLSFEGHSKFTNCSFCSALFVLGDTFIKIQTYPFIDCYWTNLFLTFPLFKGFQSKVLHKLSQILDTIQNIYQDCNELEREAPYFPSTNYGRFWYCGTGDTRIGQHQEKFSKFIICYCLL